MDEFIEILSRFSNHQITSDDLARLRKMFDLNHPYKDFMMKIAIQKSDWEFVELMLKTGYRDNQPLMAAVQNHNFEQFQMVMKYLSLDSNPWRCFDAVSPDPVMIWEILSQKSLLTGFGTIQILEFVFQRFPPSEIVMSNMLRTLELNGNRILLELLRRTNFGSTVTGSIGIDSST